MCERYEFYKIYYAGKKENGYPNTRYPYPYPFIRVVTGYCSLRIRPVSGGLLSEYYPYPSWIKKIPVSISEKTGIFTIRILYTPGIPDPFSPLVAYSLSESSNDRCIEDMRNGALYLGEAQINARSVSPGFCLIEWRWASAPCC